MAADENAAPAFNTAPPKTMGEKHHSVLIPSIPQLSSTTDKPMTCNCSKGACHQLYCICLKNGAACQPGVCQCSGCQNDERESAVKARADQMARMDAAVRKGCNCKSNCKKNYCICHSKGLMCDPVLCHCQKCYNKVGAGPVPAKTGLEGKM